MERKDHYEYRLFRRTRQACVNCRRKKIRCSGDRPICTYCARLRQKCSYEGALKAEAPQHDGPPRLGATSEADKDEASPLHSLEARMVSIENTMQSLVHLLTSDRGAFAQGQGQYLSPSRGETVSFADDAKWLSLTCDMSLSSAADLYFQYCYNQPYSLFHEQTLRENLASQKVPDYLCLALIATASRFSPSGKPLTHLATRAWELVVNASTADSEPAESLAIAQTSHLLSVIDYSDGQCRAAWIKLGLAIRVAQCSRFNTEPDPSLRVERQEEYRRTYWSIYLLDRLMSCGRERPPALRDRDCRLRLPASENDFRNSCPNRSPTLDQVTGDAPAVTSLLPQSHFAVMILMAATLNRVVRYALREDSRLRDDVPWATSSQYSALESTLWRLELHYGLLDPLDAIWPQTLTLDGAVDPRIAGPLIYGRALFHLMGCLLHHPFLLQHRLADSARTPPGFLSKAWTSARNHATALTILHETGSIGSVTVSCFRGYCSMVAGSIHLLFASDSNEEISRASVQRYEKCRGLLLDLCRYWESSRRMFVKLERLYKDRSRYRRFIEYAPMTNGTDEKPKMSIFWDSIDNWVPSNRSPSPEQIPSEQIQPIHFNTSMDFFEIAPLDPWVNGPSLLEMDFPNGMSNDFR